MDQRFTPRPASGLAILAGAVLLYSTVSQAAPRINGSKQGGNDQQLQYTVTVDSAQFGKMRQTRKIHSHEMDDFTDKTVPPQGIVTIPRGCPQAELLPRDANNAMMRQTQVRLAPIVNSQGVANIRLLFMGTVPSGTHKTVKVKGKILLCPEPITLTESKDLAVPIDGNPTTVTLSDGTKVTVAVKN